MVVARRQWNLVVLGRILWVLLIASSSFSASVEGGSEAGAVDDLWGHLSPAAFRQRSLIGIARSIADEYPDVVWPAAEKFMEAVGMETIDDRIVITIGNETTDLPPVTSECPLCKAFATLIKFGNYTVLETAVIDLCVRIFKPFGVRVDPLCNGTIKLQGPYIAAVLKYDRGKPSVSVEDFCEYLNACFPPPANSNGTQKSTEIGEGQSARQQRLSRRQSRQTERKEEERKQRRVENETRQKQATIKVVQLTDIHVERSYAVNSSTECGLPVCCLSKWGPGDAGHLGDFHCNIPILTIEFFLERVKTFNPDIVLFSGDVPPHTVWDETLASQMDCSEVLVETLERNLTGYKVYPVIGNHEMYPTNLFSLNHLSYTMGFVFNWKTLWAPMANISTNDFEASGSYSTLLRPGLRLVTFNSNYFYTFNWFNVLNDIDDDGKRETEDMRIFLQTSLEEAKNNGEKVILVGHHPPGGADYIVKESRWFVQLVLNYSDVIVLMPTGHTHIDEFRLIFDDADQPQGVVYVSPSISAGGQKNPSMRVYHLDATTYEVLDYDHYFLDLRPALEYYTSGKSSGSIDWKMMITLLYSAKNEYGLPDLSPKSWHDLLKRFDTNPDLLAKHRRHSSADASSNSGQRCSDYCKGSHICRMSNANYDEYLDCIPERTPPQGPGIGGSTPPQGPGIGGSTPPQGPGIGGSTPPQGPGIGGSTPPQGPGIGGSTPPQGPGIGGGVESGGRGLAQVVALTFLCSIIALVVPQLLILVQSKIDF